MAKRHQVGYVVYITDPVVWDECIEVYKKEALKGMVLTSRAHRLENLAEIRYVGHPPRPWDADPLAKVGSLGVKSWGEKLPWYKGWLGSLRARWELRRMAVQVG